MTGGGCGLHTRWCHSHAIARQHRRLAGIVGRRGLASLSVAVVMFGVGEIADGVNADDVGGVAMEIHLAVIPLVFLSLVSEV